MEIYYSGKILFEEEADDKVLGILEEIFGNYCEPSLKDANEVIICLHSNNIHDCDLEYLTGKTELAGNRMISAEIEYSGDFEGKYKLAKDVWTDYPSAPLSDFSDEEVISEARERNLKILSDLSVSELRTALNEKCLKEKTLGWKGKTEGISEPDFTLGCTTDEDLAGDKDVIAYILTEMLSDDENDSTKLTDLYRQANETERAVMDSVLVCVCGWTMGHIMQEAPELEDL